MVVARFEVCLVRLDPAEGHEIQKTRPCLVISPDEMNRHIRTVICLVPLIFDKGSPQRANVSLDYGLLRAIDHEAKQRGMTRSAFLSSAARNEIERR